VKRFGHDLRWREFLQDVWLEYDPVREDGNWVLGVRETTSVLKIANSER